MAKPKLGQHFLKEERFVSKAVQAAELNQHDAVIEVGPGKGVLTKALCRSAGLVLALELDGRLADGLHARLGHLENLEIRQTDARTIDWQKLGSELAARGYQSMKLVSNLPYYLASQMVIHALAPSQGCQRIVVMVQAEVARRMNAEPGSKDYSAYTLAVQYYASTRLICTVPPKAFMPPPNVMSALICLDKRSQPALALADEDHFFYYVHAMFAHRRKTLRKCMQGATGAPSQAVWDEIIAQTKLDPKRRPETLTMQEFAQLIAAIKK